VREIAMHISWRGRQRRSGRQPATLRCPKSAAEGYRRPPSRDPPV